MPDVRSAVAVQEDTVAQRRANQAAYIAKLGPQLREVLPRHIPEERFVRLAIRAARSQDKLMLATPLSLAGSLMTASVLGLEPNTPTGECYVVPYENRKARRDADGNYPVEAQLIVGYQGYVKLFRNHPLAADIYGEAVYPEDEFHYARGTSPYIHHVPKKEDRAEDSKPTHYYAVGMLTNGAKPFVVLTAEEVRKLRRGKEGPSGDIPDPQRWMERKTAIRQLTKLLPKDTRLSLAAQVDEATGTELYAQQVKSERLGLLPTDADPTAGELAGPVEDPPEGAGTEGL